MPADRDPQPVRTFQAFTPDLHELAAWLKRCGIETVALESTGIYWISLYEVLEQYGFEVRVVNAMSSIASEFESCTACIERQLASFEIKTPLPNAKQTLQTQLHQVCGVDLTKIPSIKEQTAQIIISEVGLDMSRWPS